MHAGVRRKLSWVVIFTIALHTILWGVATPLAAGPAIDPFSVICHSGAQAADEHSPASPASTPAQACDHCNLCSVAAPPVTLATALAGQLAPARLLHILRPASAATHASLLTTPKLATGPPSFA